MDTIIGYLRETISMIPTIKVMDVIDILLVAFLIYGAFTMIQSTGTMKIAKSVIIILLLAGITDIFNMYLTNYLLDQVLEIGVIALVIMFQPELRRVLESWAARACGKF